MKIEAKKKGKPKPPYQLGGVFSAPGEAQAKQTADSGFVACKPGHWSAVVLRDLKANEADFQGDLTVFVGSRNGSTDWLEESAASLTSLRRVALARGHAKTIEASFFPGSARGDSVVYRLGAFEGGRSVFEGQIALRLMPANQYHCFVLARQPSRYKYVASLPSATPQSDVGDVAAPWLRVQVGGGAAKRILFPSSMLNLTSTACLLWDDADPAWLDPRQQQALVDWLHWGGVLIVSGPESLDSLRGSFLEPYLPAHGAGTCSLGEEEFADLGRFAPGAPAFRPAQPLSGVRWQLAEAAQAVPGTGGLVVERRCGRGRVVVSAFRLGDSELTRWPGWDGVFNACLLRRPARDYRIHQQKANGYEELAAGQWADGASLDDPTKITAVRLFSRDFSAVRRAAAVPSDSDHHEPADHVDGGAAAWNDRSPAAMEARAALARAAQIEIPPRNFVLWMLAGYLAVLGPVNWCVFRVLGRVEWLWAAAPVIALAWTVVVVREAQLDIGFVRARTEIDVLELQGGHPRGHLTRYAALYTSLSTEYTFAFDDPAAALLPWDLAGGDRLPRQSLESLVCRRGEKAELRGIAVPSNSLRFVHGEQMFDLKGPLELTGAAGGGYRLRNATGLDLRGAGLLFCDEDGKLFSAWIGNLAPGESADALANPASSGPFWKAQREAVERTVSAAPSGGLSLRGLLDLAANAETLAPGDARLVAYVEGDLPGMTVAPAAMQKRSAAVVVANLKFGFGAAPAPDINPPRPPQR